MPLPSSNTPDGKMSWAKPPSLIKTLLIPVRAHLIGDRMEIVFKEGGNTSTGTQTPPMAESITTEMAATGKA